MGTLIMIVVGLFIAMCVMGGAMKFNEILLGKKTAEVINGVSFMLVLLVGAILGLMLWIHSC